MKKYLTLMLSIFLIAKSLLGEPTKALFQLEYCQEKSPRGLVEYEIYTKNFPVINETAFIQKTTHESKRIRRVLIHPAEIKVALWSGIMSITFENADGKESRIVIQDLATRQSTIQHNGGAIKPLDCSRPDFDLQSFKIQSEAKTIELGLHEGQCIKSCDKCPNKPLYFCEKGPDAECPYLCVRDPW